MLRSFVATQTLQNEEFREKVIHINENQRQLNIVFESLMTTNKEMETTSICL